MTNPGVADINTRASVDGVSILTNYSTDVSTSESKIVSINEGITTSIQSSNFHDGSIIKSTFINGILTIKDDLDKEGLLTSSIQFTYDEFLRLDYTLDNRGNQVSYTYDNSGNILTILTLDPDNNPATDSTPGLREQIYETVYDNMGRRDLVKNPDGIEINFEYNLKSELISTNGANASYTLIFGF